MGLRAYMHPNPLGFEGASIEWLTHEYHYITIASRDMGISTRALYYSILRLQNAPSIMQIERVLMVPQQGDVLGVCGQFSQLQANH